MIDQDYIWQEGKYIDFWSIPHVIIGALLAWIFEFVGLNFYLNLGLSFGIMFGWEFFELYVLHAEEYLPNKVMDVVTGLIGFFIMYYFILVRGLINMLNVELTLGVIYLTLCGWGLWHHYHRNSVKKLK
jgi:hypothetical protein